MQTVSQNAPIQSNPRVPLCVDLDGTLINTDLLFESFVLLVRRRPFYALLAPVWLLSGKANLKREIAVRTTVDAATLPYHRVFLEFLAAEKAAGRQLYLVTGSDAGMAENVARHLSFFDEVIGSDGQTNLLGRTKGKRLAERFGLRGFDYAGNSNADLAVWEFARQGIVVNAGSGLEQRARRLTEVSRVFAAERPWQSSFIRLMRPHQWVKNLIILVPLLTSHSLTHRPVIVSAMLAFAAFSLCASSMYIINDLMDLESDRHHLSKRLRPLACGAVSIPTAITTSACLFAGAVAIACAMPLEFSLVLAIYAALTLGYSWRFKQVALLDVFFLAGLYTIRLIAGHAATGIVYSFWLLVFSMFIFLSLALVKRFQEIDAAHQNGREAIKGRGYFPPDRELVSSLGATSGFMAVLVMALYVKSDEVQALYHRPILLLLICPLLLFWISRVWLIAHRGLMHEDPIVFALRDKTSYIVGALVLVVVWLATGR